MCEHKHLELRVEPTLQDDGGVGYFAAGKKTVGGVEMPYEQIAVFARFSAR